MTDNTNEVAISGASKLPEHARTGMGKAGVIIRNLDDLWRVSKWIMNGNMGMKDDTTEKVAIKIQMGLELGMSPMMAVQNIAVINGRPCVWGDAIPGVVRGRGHMEYFKEEEVGTYPNPDYGWRITSKRKDDPNPLVTTFTVQEAKTAKLWGKTGKSGNPTPWVLYPKRMLKMRCRGFNLRDNFPDDLKGINLAEEMMDMPPVDAEYEVIDEGTHTDKLADLVAPSEPDEPAQEEGALNEPVAGEDASDTETMPDPPPDGMPF